MDDQELVRNTELLSFGELERRLFRTTSNVVTFHGKTVIDNK